MSVVSLWWICCWVLRASLGTSLGWFARKNCQVRPRQPGAASEGRARGSDGTGGAALRDRGRWSHKANRCDVENDMRWTMITRLF